MKLEYLDTEDERDLQEVRQGREQLKKFRWTVRGPAIQNQSAGLSGPPAGGWGFQKEFASINVLFFGAPFLRLEVARGGSSTFTFPYSHFKASRLRVFIP